MVDSIIGILYVYMLQNIIVYRNVMDIRHIRAARSQQLSRDVVQSRLEL